MKDDTPPHFYHEMHQHLNDTILTILHPLRILSKLYMKDSVHVPPMSSTLQDLRGRIVTAVSSITRDQLLLVWQEMNCRFYLRRITTGAHVECIKKTLNFPLSND
ncbi:hypothetical protein AVEN_197519-1 [Araneus ventricosus]|uniref:Uncharacterized protein n=1 Tax=Araneus ventricosus TaxID=182803 RepID=A0A4Y2BU66_ARAVE|nr:hypothetical protein AVEN_197519-1 [Araneus ventricosus]